MGHDARETSEDGRASSSAACCRARSRQSIRRETADVATFELTTTSPFRLLRGPIQHAVRVWPRRSGDQHQRRPRRRETGSCTRCGASARSVARSPGCVAARSLGCADPMARTGPSPRAKAATSSSSPAGSVSLRCGPVIYRVLAHRERYGRVVVLYGARGPTDILYRRELESMAAASRCRHRGHSRSRRGRLARQCRRRTGIDPARRRSIRIMQWRWCAGPRS